jgi:hypothetical protein
VFASDLSRSLEQSRHPRRHARMSSGLGDSTSSTRTTNSLHIFAESPLSRRLRAPRTSRQVMCQ